MKKLDLYDPMGWSEKDKTMPRIISNPRNIWRMTDFSTYA